MTVLSVLSGWLMGLMLWFLGDNSIVRECGEVRPRAAAAAAVELSAAIDMMRKIQREKEVLWSQLNCGLPFKYRRDFPHFEGETGNGIEQMLSLRNAKSAIFL